MKLYVMLDGSADVTAAKRCALAARVGYYAHVCILPPDRDPDELTVDELDAIEAAARPVLDAWLDMLGETDAGSDARRKILHDFGRHLAEWSEAEPGAAGEMRGRATAALNMSPEDYDAWLRRSKARKVSGGESNVLYPDQPRPLGPSPKGDGRKLLSNFVIEPREVKDKNGNPKMEPKRIAREPDDVRARMFKVTQGWPLRIYSPGAQYPILFVDHGDGKLQMITRSLGLANLLKKRSKLQIQGGQDFDGSNFYTVEDLFEDMASATDLVDYLNFEYFPHEPPLPGHYYTWHAPENYDPTGEKALEFLLHFDNLEDDVSRVLCFAALLTLYWGGDYGLRPIFIFEAKQPGSGKSTCAQLLAELVGPAGSKYIKVSFGSAKQEDQLMERLLSPAALLKRVVLWDNVKRTVEGELLEGLVTDRELSGRRMYQGEASRPNSLCWFISINNAKVSSDVARRSFRIGFNKPAEVAGWRRQLVAYARRWQHHIAADAVKILKRPVQARDVSGVGETNQDWVADVLARAVDFLNERGVTDLTLRQVVEQNARWRHDRDTDVGEASEFMEALLDHYAAKYLDDEPKDFFSEKREVEAVWIPTADMMKRWEECFDQELRSTKQLVNILTAHIEAGRMAGLEHVRQGGTGRRGFILVKKAIEEHVAKRKSARETATV